MNNQQREFCRHPHHPFGCGWLIVGVVALIVLVASAAGIYQEVNFHPGLVNPAADTLQDGVAPAIDDSTLEDHSGIPDTFATGIDPEIQRAHDSSRKAIWGDSL